ncbi:hypothetical protein N7G274_006753 [Stereocaulon virgatum]|uniref:Uncharacterized protein n=1 Tax=Stereocaulon virgatum TaxID=373712 RepID=A0ABR4A364_9LECA
MRRSSFLNIARPLGGRVPQPLHLQCNQDQFFPVPTALKIIAIPWSRMSTRPSRNAPAPPPAANALYCHTCGRIISPRKSHTHQPTPQKYCSDRCRREKPRRDIAGHLASTSTEARIERVFVRFLGGDREKRVVGCREVEGEVFGREDGQRVSGGDGVDEGGGRGPGEGDSDDDDDEDEDDEGGGVPLPSSSSSSETTGQSTENEAPLSSQQLGLKRARQREMVRQAARRGVAFGFDVDGVGRRNVDCVQGGRVVDSSFAKGDWGVRWRE